MLGDLGQTQGTAQAALEFSRELTKRVSEIEKEADLLFAAVSRQTTMRRLTNLLAAER